MKSQWRKVADAARNTVGKDAGKGEPSDRWKKRILLSEHSPIRLLTYTMTLKGIMSWVSVHLTRHKFGIEHFVSTQRTDRTGKNRNESKQSALVNHMICANAQAIINISRKRLCFGASPETREAWIEFVDYIAEVDPVLASVCVPECVYRGFCPEFYPCGRSETLEYERLLTDYRNTEGENQNNAK